LGRGLYKGINPVAPKGCGCGQRALLSLKRLSHSHVAVLDVSVSPQRVGPFARRVRDARYHL